jgi:hypothetical protein
MSYKQANFLKGARIQQQFQPLTGRLFPFRMLGGDAFFVAIPLSTGTQCFKW